MRIIPKDPRALVADGPAVTGRWQPACSWCGVVFQVKKGVFFCSVCDNPRPSGDLRPINIEKECGSDD